MFKVLHKDPPIPESLSDEGKDFLRSCFRRNPATRPTAFKLLEHPFIWPSHYKYNSLGNLQGLAGSKTTVSLGVIQLVLPIILALSFQIK